MVSSGISRPSSSLIELRRKVPPGRTSSVTDSGGVLQPRLPHQRAISAGSVHARQTRSRGASKTRVIVISRAEVLIEAVEALIPVAAVLGDPVGDLLERRALQP